MAHPGGRPRTTSFPPEEMIKLGEEMVDWVTKNNPLHLSEWYTIHKGFIYKEWKSFIQRQEFIPYYEQAMKIVAKQYLDKNSNVREGVSQRWQRIYFAEVREEEDAQFDRKLEKEKQAKLETLREEYAMKQKLGEIATQEQLEVFNNLINHFRARSSIDFNNSNITK